MAQDVLFDDHFSPHVDSICAISSVQVSLLFARLLLYVVVSYRLIIHVESLSILDFIQGLLVFFLKADTENQILFDSLFVLG